jgi:oligoribonuclease NrnB/cAMP/cGMP phosphodiesterase (DHH superfamily)
MNKKIKKRKIKQNYFGGGGDKKAKSGGESDQRILHRCMEISR